MEIKTTKELEENIINKYKDEIESELLATLTNDINTQPATFTDAYENTYEIKIEKMN